jgi:hypothetical protein
LSPKPISRRALFGVSAAAIVGATALPRPAQAKEQPPAAQERVIECAADLFEQD